MINGNEGSEGLFVQLRTAFLHGIGGLAILLSLCSQVYNIPFSIFILFCLFVSFELFCFLQGSSSPFDSYHSDAIAKRVFQNVDNNVDRNSWFLT
jgi:hypothetical protein